MIDLLLIEPSLDFKSDQDAIIRRRILPNVPNQEMPPLGIGYIMSNADMHGLNTKFIDMIADSLSINDVIKYIQEWNPLVVGFYAITAKIKFIHLIAESIKSVYPDVLICCGGPHVTALPKETLEQFKSIDFIVCGEADQIIIDVIQNLKNKNIHGISGIVTRQSNVCTINRVSDINSLPFPAWNKMQLDKYLGGSPHRTDMELPMINSRGCPFSCVFCARNHGNIRRQRTDDSIIAEINHNIDKYNCQSIFFADETFVVNVKKTIRLFSRFIKEGISEKIKWGCECRVGIGSLDLFKLMKQSGCYSVFFGLESGDDTILNMACKGITVQQIRTTVKMAQDVGIICFGSFIIGLPGETESTVQKSIELAEDLHMHSTTFPVAVPFPGSELRRMAMNNEHGLRIISNDWSLYGKQSPCVMESDSLLSEDRMRLQKEAYARIPKKVF